MKISLIIPIYNESKTVEAMLSQLEALPGDWEILFADGGSTDDTIAKIGSRYRVLRCPKGRANQMNFAAKQVSADVLWFVHCDSRIPVEAHSQISSAVEQGKQWGCFHIGFDYHGPFMGCNTYFSNRRARKGIAFGDQGIWVTKALFAEKGGFPDLPIIGSAFSYLRHLAPELAAGMVKGGHCAMAGFGRLAFACPDFPRRLSAGETISPCVTCGGCALLLRAGSPAGCVVRDRECYSLEVLK